MYEAKPPGSVDRAASWVWIASKTEARASLSSSASPVALVACRRYYVGTSAYAHGPPG